MIDWVNQAKMFGVMLTNDQVNLFQQYQAFLIEWNQHTNLTAICEPAAIQIRHFLDSLSCITVMGDLHDQRLIDIGTGAGFPGIPLKIVYPGLHLTLADSVGKKTKFLEAVVAKLALEDVQIITERAEVLGKHPAHRTQYDWAVARGVAKMPTLVEYLLPLCRQGGHCLAQKGRGAPDEVKTALAAIQKLGGKPPTLHPIQLPAQPHIHYLVMVEKQKRTPAQYPRRIGIPAKTPLYQLDNQEQMCYLVREIYTK